MPSPLRKSATRVRDLFALHSGFASKAHYSITDGHAFGEVIFEGNNIYSDGPWSVWL